MKNKQYLCTVITKSVSMDAQYSPAATVADIEIMQNVSRRTAERLMRQFKKECGVPKYKRPTLSDLKRWFGKA